LVVDPANVRAHFSLALLHLDQQNLEKSEEMFLKALQLDPTYRSALYNLGVLYNHQARVKNAIMYLQQLVSQYPEHLNGAQLLGDCYMKTQRQDLAEQMYSHVLQRNPNHTAALHNLGKLVEVNYCVVNNGGWDHTKAHHLHSTGSA
jgi:tetratricopeptide (TPR) repeat protein